jgi:hypothetical protein
MLAPITEIFCDIDDFCKLEFKQGKTYVLPNPHRQHQRPCRLSLSEIMTICVLFHLSHYRTFKDYYQECVCQQLQSYFPQLVSYNRFIELMPSITLPLLAYLLSKKGRATGLYYVDSTALAVCHNRRIHGHKTFDTIAARGKTSVDWFFGLKLHLVINHVGELLSFCLTRGNVDDRMPLEFLFKGLQGFGAGDRGYVSQQKTQRLLTQGLTFITKLRRNMKNKAQTAFEKAILSQRCIIEAIIDQLKSICQIEHTRHRSPFNFLINLLSGLVAYVLKPRKPKVNFNFFPANARLLISN